MILSADERVGGYLVLGVLGSGAASQVYRVRERSTGSTFALKLLTDPTLVRSSRFSTEAGILIRLRHRNIVRCHGFMVVKRHPAMLLELADGTDLFNWLQLQGRTGTDPQRLALLADMLRGVAAAHTQGVIHRDIKPANALLVPWGDGIRLKVADFGMAKILSDQVFSAHITRTGTAMGTLGYMAPEQSMDAKRVDHRADIWSIGCIAYELLVGGQAFPGSELVAVLNRCMRGQYPPVEALAPGLPRHQVETVQACLEPDPDNRPQSCAEVAVGMGLPEGLCAPPQVVSPAHAVPSPPTQRRAGAGLATLLPDDWAE